MNSYLGRKIDEAELTEAFGTLLVIAHRLLQHRQGNDSMPPIRMHAAAVNRAEDVFTKYWGAEDGSGRLSNLPGKRLDSDGLAETG